MFSVGSANLINAKMLIYTCFPSGETSSKILCRRTAIFEHKITPSLRRKSLKDDRGSVFLFESVRTNWFNCYQPRPWRGYSLIVFLGTLCVRIDHVRGGGAGGSTDESYEPRPSTRVDSNASSGKLVWLLTDSTPS